MMDDTEQESRELVIFGKNVSKIPCFRNSFLYGISTGVATGFGTFMFTSRPRLSTNVGFGLFFATTLGYWIQCRYTWSKTRFEYAKLQGAMKHQALYEGTALEREVIEKSESV